MVPCAAKTLLIVLLPGTSLGDWQKADAPNLHMLMAEGAVAVMNTRTARLPNDRMRETPESAALTLGAGARAAGGPEALDFYRTDQGLPGMGEMAGAFFTRRMDIRPPAGSRVNVQWPRLLRANALQEYDVHLGNLADGLRHTGVIVKALGGPLAFSVAANGSGWIPPTSPSQAADQCLIWDAGSNPALADPSLGRWMARLASGRIIILSPSAGDAAYAQGDRLCPVATWPSAQPGLIVSPSTRRPGLVTNTDLAPTVAAYFGAALPVTPFGRPWGLRGSPDAVARAQFLSSAALQQWRAMRVLPFLAIFLGVWVLAVTFLPCPRPVRETCALLPPALIFAMTVGSSFGGLSAWLGLIVVLLAAGRRLGAEFLGEYLTAAIAVVLVLDMLLHDPLMPVSLLGYSAIEGARYYGIGNEAMGALIGACLVTAQFLWRRLTARMRWLVPGGLLLVTALLGSPLAGAKAGGLIVALASFGTYLWLAAGRAWHWRAAGVAIISSVTIMLLVASIDAHLGADRQSHFGQAVGRLGHGGAKEWVEIAARKLFVEGRLLYHSAWAVPLWGGMLSVLWLRRWLGPATRPLLTAGLVAAFICLLVNDAGTVAAALCLSVIWGSLSGRSAEKARRLTVQTAG